MKAPRPILLGILGLMTVALAAPAEIVMTIGHNDSDQASPAFKFSNVPSPAKTDAGTKAVFSIVAGDADQNGGGISQLNDGRLPSEEDAPGDNFFFAQGGDGGRIVADLNEPIEIKQVNSYSWHTDNRAPQVYQLFASDGTDPNFDTKPAAGKDPTGCGWKLIAKVDTRKEGDPTGGQYGVSISDSTGAIGKFRYLLFAISPTEGEDSFGNTFYSEIDIVDKNRPAVTNAPGTAEVVVHSFKTNSTDGKCEIIIDTTAAPDLTDWAETKLAPVLAEWYPKIVAMLPSDGFNPPTKFSVFVKPGNGVADTSGTRVNVYSPWVRKEINGQAVGSVLHEEVHVIQQYGHGRRNNPNATRSPGWLVEGIPDYIRFYKFEPQIHGADINKRGLERAKYDRSYRVTANFLNWVGENHDKDIIQKLNAAMRDAKYTEEIWKTNTGKTVQELGDEWKASLEKALGDDKPDAPKIQ